MADQPAEQSEVDRLDPQPVLRKLSTGLEVEVVRLRTRQFFRLLKVLTHGAGQALIKSALDFNAEPGEFMSKLLSVVLISIPDAEQEAIDFLRSMVKPAHLPDKPLRQMSKQEQEHAQEAWDELERVMYNPELDDLIDLIGDIVTQESADIQALGKRVASLLELATKTGQTEDGTPAEAPSPKELSEAPPPESSPPPSTSSAASTGGTTSASSTSPSAGSAKSPKRSRSGSDGKLSSVSS